ncbi:MAG TPA: hypothetical protein VKA63_08185 [Candidatus Krumholzibacteria bacterium]|nr:hypothetical protein [Candidatus Krumholzibacteria bacterium]
MNDDEKFFEEKMRDYQAPRCPEELVDRIMARVDAEPQAEPQPKWWTLFRLRHALVPAAALAVVLFVLLRLSPQPPSTPLPEIENPQVSIAPPETTSTPCELDLQEILRRLGAKDRAQLAYDDTTLCEAAEDVRMALNLMGKAMHSTERVLRNETRRRVADTVRMGLEASSVSPAPAAANPGNGG